MFVLRFKAGATLRIFSYEARDWVDTDVGGRYFSHTATREEGDTTTKLEKAKVYNTASGAKCNAWAYKCDIVPVFITLDTSSMK